MHGRGQQRENIMALRALQRIEENLTLDNLSHCPTERDIFLDTNLQIARTIIFALEKETSIPPILRITNGLQENPISNPYGANREEVAKRNISNIHNIAKPKGGLPWPLE